MSVAPLRRDDQTAVFLDGTARGEFLLRRCPLGHWSEPAAQVCPACGRSDLDWVPAAGTARLVSWSVAYGRPAGDQPPRRTVLAIVELDEGPWWWTRLDGVDPDQVQAGMPLQVAFARADDEYEAVPVFGPASRTATERTRSEE